MSPAVSNEPKELFGQGLLASFWGNENLNNFALKGSDGVEVAANRFILSAKSKIFQNMLLGQFKEASSAVVEVGFPGKVLEQVVEYIYTDEIQGVTTLKRKSSNDDSPQVVRDQVQHWMQLLEASVYFDLPRLQNKARKIIKGRLRKGPTRVVFLALEAARGAIPPSPELAKLAMAQIKTFDSSKIKACDVGVLSSSVLKEILKKKGMSLAEFERFELLQLWGEESETLSSSLQPAFHEDRQSLSSKMVDHIDLSKIDQKQLSNVVLRSGFVSSEKLLKNFAGKSKVPPGCPSSIKVTGAGYPAVNGLYRYVGHHGMFPKYFMKDGEHDFLVYKYAHRWYISAVRCGKESRTDSDMDIIGEYYRCPKPDRDTIYPPEGTWVDLAGLDPPPRVSIAH